MDPSAPWLGMLMVFSGLSMNLLVHFGLGMKELSLAVKSDLSEMDKKKFFSELGIFFTTTLLLWILLSFFRSVFPLGFLEYVMLFPAALLGFCALDYLVYRFILVKSVKVKSDKQSHSVMGNIYTGAVLCGSGLFIMLNIAGNFLEAAVLSFGFTLGIALAIVTVGEIRRRSEMEAVPRSLRGGPLALIAMGLLSLIFSSAAMMFYELLGAL